MRGWCSHSADPGTCPLLSPAQTHKHIHYLNKTHTQIHINIKDMLTKLWQLIYLAKYMSKCIWGRWRDLAEMFRNMSVTALLLKFFFIYFWGGYERWRLCSCYCCYHSGPHGQPAGLIRLRGHLPQLASYLGPWDSGPRYWGPRCLTGSEIISRRRRMRRSGSLWDFFFKAKGNSCQPSCF